MNFCQIIKKNELQNWFKYKNKTLIIINKLKITKIKFTQFKNE